MKFFSNKILLLFLFITPTIWAQFKLKDSIELPSENISHLKTNAFGDVLMVVNDRELIKIDSKKNIKRHPLKKIVTQLDTNLSLKTGVVYNYQELEILDDQLNPIQDKINFNQHQIFPSVISISDSQTLWYFDPIEQRLFQWNYQLGKVLNKSNTLHFKENDYSIIDIHQTNNRVFLKSQNRIYEYDLFGNFKSETEIKSDLNYSFYDIYLVSSNKETINLTNLLNKEISSFDNFFNGKDFTMRGDELFVIKNKGLYIYTRIKK